MNQKKKKPKRFEWEINKVFQDRWVARFHWFEPIYGLDGKMRMVKCKIYFDSEGRENLIIPKLDSFIKHFGTRKCSKAKLGVLLW